MLNNEMLDKIERDARLAKEGPWEVQTSCSFRRIGQTHRGDGNVLCGGIQQYDGHPDLNATMETLQHIANCDPQTVSELVKMARRYAYLRNAPSEVPARGLDVAFWDDHAGEAIRGEELDQAIDTAINSQRKEGGEE